MTWPAEEGLGVVLVPTLMPGVNMENIGAIIFFAVNNMPAVRGVHFQPISYFGKYPLIPCDQDRITIPKVIRRIEHQTKGLLIHNASVKNFTATKVRGCIPGVILLY